jgi:hypothetical protein
MPGNLRRTLPFPDRPVAGGLDTERLLFLIAMFDLSNMEASSCASLQFL